MATNGWFYSDASRQQQGPVDDAALARLFQEGRIDARTLVWREGLPEWRPLASFASELPWWSAPPPPLPMGAPPTSAMPPPPKRSGCAVAAVVLAVVAVFGFALIGILAAIAIPAYQDYVHRAAMMQQIIATAPLKMRIEQAYAQAGACPTDFPVQPSDVPDGFSEVWVGRFEDGTCGAQFTFAAHPKLPDSEGKKLWVWLDESGTRWSCRTEFEQKFVPANCRD